MKKLIYIFLFSLSIAIVSLSTGCKTGNADAVSPQEDDSLRNAYYDDGARLTIRSMARVGSDEIKIPRDSIDYYVERLVEVYYYIMRSNNTDSIDQLTTVHAFENPSLHVIDVDVKPGTVWLADWNSNAPAVNNKEANTLIKKYKLKLIRLINDGQNATVSSDAAINPYALADAFRKLPGVKDAHPDERIGPTQDIYVYHLKKGTKVTYMKGSGDCASGCIHKKYWDFTIDNKGKVSYSGTRGSLPKDTATAGVR
jgi:hypothetical protein